jgi:DNA polymerase IV
LVASVVVAPNKYLAKLASDIGKPDGFVVLEPDKVTEFLAPLPVSRIWGVGKKAEQRLHDLGTVTCLSIHLGATAMPTAVFRDFRRVLGLFGTLMV